MGVRTYASPAAFLAALESRVRDRAKAEGRPMNRVRTLLVMERFLARIAAVFPQSTLLKGGLALELRLDTLAPEVETFRLADVGCPVDWPQPFVLGVEYAVAEPAVWIGTYGSPASRRYAPLVWGANGTRDDFRFVEGGFVVAGRVLAHDGSRATISLDEVSWRGVGLCEPGVYGVPLARATAPVHSSRRYDLTGEGSDGEVSGE